MENRKYNLVWVFIKEQRLLGNLKGDDILLQTGETVQSFKHVYQYLDDKEYADILSLMSLKDSKRLE